MDIEEFKICCFIGVVCAMRQRGAIMSDPAYLILRFAFRTAWSGARWLIQRPDAQQVLKAAAAQKATHAVDAGVEELRERGVNVPPAVEVVAETVAGVAGGYAAGRALGAAALQGTAPQGAAPQSEAVPPDQAGRPAAADSAKGLLPIHHYQGAGTAGGAQTRPVESRPDVGGISMRPVEGRVLPEVGGVAMRPVADAPEIARGVFQEKPPPIPMPDPPPPPDPSRH
ncbi:hypothetical protein AGRA3207_002777 [Actinomadura graeca]|uniref:Uncharacterized protein n=1 Tax=Actinomadura graeca TaxID=2750812 RepID=A0ABX8QT03_9ACTN|nr:hypothetical protein [Actinomadura graeca]QXJ21872.1 hypothetical protein AGRA3207_002777 [Actinomadura graeca]